VILGVGARGWQGARTALRPGRADVSRNIWIFRVLAPPVVMHRYICATRSNRDVSNLKLLLS